MKRELSPPPAGKRRDLEGVVEHFLEELDSLTVARNALLEAKSHRPWFKPAGQKYLKSLNGEAWPATQAGRRSCDVIDRRVIA